MTDPPALADADPKIREFFESAPGEHAAIMRSLRRLFVDVAPEAEEMVKWNSPLYAVADEYCVGYRYYSEHVNLILWYGADLEDPEGIIEGTGKRRRHVTLTSPDDVERSDVRAVVERAVDHARRRP